MKPNIAIFVLFCAPTIAVFSSQTANAASCVNDIDCTAGGTACGSQICSWPKGKICVPAAGASPSDSWCGGNYGSGESQAVANAECKCHAVGATCNLATYHCTSFEPSVTGGPVDSGSARSDASSGSSSGRGPASGGDSGAVVDSSAESVEGGAGSSGSSSGSVAAGGSSSGGSSSSSTGSSSSSGGGASSSTGSGSSSGGTTAGSSSGANTAGGGAGSGSSGSGGAYASATPGASNEGGMPSSGGYGGASQSSGCDVGSGAPSPLGAGAIVLFALVAAERRRRRA